MLELRPTCESCGVPLPPSSTDARICTFECTFCADCVEHHLFNVCPNCGGGFERRPIRPATDRPGGSPLSRNPPTTTVTEQPVDPSSHAALLDAYRDVPPELR